MAFCFVFQNVGNIWVPGLLCIFQNHSVGFVCNGDGCCSRYDTGAQSNQIPNDSQRHLTKLWLMSGGGCDYRNCRVGGFMIVPALVAGGLNMRNAVATSLMIIAMKSYSGFYKYLNVLKQQGLELGWKVIGLVTFLSEF